MSKVRWSSYFNKEKVLQVTKEERITMCKHRCDVFNVQDKQLCENKVIRSVPVTFLSSGTSLLCGSITCSSLAGLRRVTLAWCSSRVKAQLFGLIQVLRVPIRCVIRVDASEGRCKHIRAYLLCFRVWSGRMTSQEMTFQMTITMYPVLLQEWTWQSRSIEPLAKISWSSTSEGTFDAATSAPCVTSSSPSHLTRITGQSSLQSKKKIEAKKTIRSAPFARSLSSLWERTWELCTIKNHQFSWEDRPESALTRRKLRQQRCRRIAEGVFV